MDMFPPDAENPASEGPDGVHDDQIDDWLWDLEERYDVGTADDSFPTHLIGTGDDARLAEVRRYRRSKHDARASGFDRDEPTGAFAVVDGDNFEPHHIPHAVPPRHRTNRWAIAAAVVVVVALGGLAWAASQHGSRSPGPNLAVAAPTTTLPPALVGPPTISVGGPAVNGTTASTTPLTVVGVPATTAPAGRAVFTPTATTVPPRSTTPTTSHPKTTTATTSPPRTTPTTPPVVTPPPTAPTTPPTNPPATTVPTLPPQSTTTTPGPPTTPPFG